MPKQKAIVPFRGLHTTLPPDLSIQLDGLLWSELEGKVPKGAIQDLLIQLLREHFSHKRLDLGPYVSSLPGLYLISGSPATLEKLAILLEGENHGT